MKVGVSGKTGAGKTTVAALVALAAAGAGRRVLAVDTDDSPNLGISLGAHLDALAEVAQVPRVLVTGRAGGGVSAAQLVSGYGLATPSGVTVLHALPTSDETAGCGCPAHASSRSVLGAALDQEADLVVLDLEGGLDHLDRPAGTLAHVDVLVVVLEASRKSVLSAARTVDQARAHGIASVVGVGNKARAGTDGDSDSDDGTVFARFGADHAVAMAAVLPWSDEVFDADRAGTGLHLGPGPLAGAVAVLMGRLA